MSLAAICLTSLMPPSVHDLCEPMNLGPPVQSAAAELTLNRRIIQKSVFGSFHSLTLLLMKYLGHQRSQQGQ
jgi:hypothetical protein